MMKKRLLAAALALAMLYFAAYVVLRSQGVIMHFSNARHWHPEKRSSGHYIGTRSDKTFSDRVLNIVFFPAMLTEQIGRNLAE